MAFLVQDGDDLTFFNPVAHIHAKGLDRPGNAGSHLTGLAGQQTQIIINSLLAVDGTPRLSTALLAKD